MREGETVSVSTRNMIILIKEDIEYGLRIDLLVTSDGLDENDEDTELCSIEFKKETVSDSVSNIQQGRNVRINACNLNKNHPIPNKSSLDFPYYDFTDRKSYLAHKVGTFVMLKLLLDLGLFRQSIIQLYIWKRETENNNNKLYVSRIEIQPSFAFRDIANEVLSFSLSL